MKYLLDTNICINVIRKKPEKVLQRFRKETPGEIGISSITYAELQHGVYRSSQFDKNLQALEEFCVPLLILDFDRSAARFYGKIRSELESKGLPIGSMDLLIAAHGLSLGCIVVTNNEREFKRVPNLNLENWT